MQSTTHNLTSLDRVVILSEALPYLQKVRTLTCAREAVLPIPDPTLTLLPLGTIGMQFRGKTIVVKYGGAAMKDPTLKVCAGM